jgi:hypothetical protein
VGGNTQPGQLGRVIDAALQRLVGDKNDGIGLIAQPLDLFPFSPLALGWDSFAQRATLILPRFSRFHKILDLYFPQT